MNLTLCNSIPRHTRKARQNLKILLRLNHIAIHMCSRTMSEKYGSILSAHKIFWVCSQTFLLPCIMQTLFSQQCLSRSANKGSRKQWQNWKCFGNNVFYFAHGFTISYKPLVQQTLIFLQHQYLLEVLFLSQLRTRLKDMVDEKVNSTNDTPRLKTYKIIIRFYHWKYQISFCKFKYRSHICSYHANIQGTYISYY